MNISVNENSITIDKDPGGQLSYLRQQRGFTLAHVASKLRLKVHVLELLEHNCFDALPEPVFVKGYLRAYAKFLGVSPDPYLAIFNEHYAIEKKVEHSSLWQSKKESHKIEHSIRWLSILFALGLVLVLILWWYNNQDIDVSVPDLKIDALSEVSLNPSQPDLKNTDLSQVQALFIPQKEMSPLEKKGD